MPEATTLGSPPAPAAPAAPPSPTPPAPTQVLHVDGKGAIDKGPAPSPPKKGSAMEQMWQDLQKTTDRKTTQPSKPATKPAAKTADPVEPEKAPEQGKEPAKEPAKEPGDDEPPAGEAAPAAAGDKKKVSPWKLVEEHKTARATLEKELSDLRKSLPKPEEQEKVKAEVESIRKRNAELEEEIRYANFSKSKKFAEEYQKPYENAWKKAMSDLSELTVADPSSGEERQLMPQDILSLVNMPLKEARSRAEEMFGSFADDVMTHRKEIRGLFDSQNKALEDARKEGAEREEKQRQAIEEFRAQSQKEITELWQKANEEVLSDEKKAKHFKPIEGDEDGNNRLTKGYELADRAFSTPDPRDPRLKPEQREEIIRIHTAVRHRAAAFGRTLYQLQKAEAELASLKAELNKYRGAEPGSGEGNAGGQHPTSTGSAKESVFGALRKMAH